MIDRYGYKRWISSIQYLKDGIDENRRLTDKVGVITPAQCRAARGLLNWTQAQLAEAAGVGIVTIRQFEAAHAEPRQATLTVIRQAFEEAGVEFTNGSAPGVKLSQQMAPRSSTELRKLIAKGCRGRLGCKDVKEDDIKITPAPNEQRNWDAKIPSLPRAAMAEAREVIDRLRGTLTLKE